MSKSKSLEIWLVDVYFNMNKTTDTMCIKDIIASKVALKTLQKDVVFINRALKRYSDLVGMLKILEDDKETGFKKLAKVEFKRKLADGNLNYEQYCRERNIN